MERYGSKPAKRPRSDFVIEEAGQLNVVLVLLTHSTYIDVYARNYPIIINKSEIVKYCTIIMIIMKKNICFIGKTKYSIYYNVLKYTIPQRRLAMMKKTRRSGKWVHLGKLLRQTFTIVLRVLRGTGSLI